MVIIGRIYLFLNWLVISGIMFAILLIILRWIANAADLNPFAWTARTIRRLTDPMIQPVRRGLINFGVDPKYSPIATILLAVLLGWFVLQLLSNLANTLIGVLVSAQDGAAVALIGYLLYGALGLYSLLIFVRIIMSWGMMSYGNRFMRFLINVTEPLLAPLRRIIPPLGMFDISPIIAFIIIWVFQAAVAGTLLGNRQLHFLG